MTTTIMIVGCGAVAQRLYRAPLQRLQRRGLIRIQSLVDPVSAHAHAMRAYFPSALVAEDIEEGNRLSPSQLTLVLSPANLHARHVLAALEQGSHVLCEKPLAFTAADCRRMVDAARDAQRVLAVGMVRRFFPGYAHLQSLVASGCLGTLERFEYCEGRKFDWDVTTTAAFRPRTQGGTGVLFDIGPHAIDCLSWIFGQLGVLGYSDDALAGVESNVTMDLQSSSCEGSVRLSWDSPLANELRVLGSNAEAVLRVDQFAQLAVRTSSHFEPVKATVSFPSDLRQSSGVRLRPTSYAQAIYCQLIQTLRAVLCGEPPAADGEAGEQCIQVLEAALSRARPLEMPWLDEKRQTQYRQLHWTSRA